MNKQSIYTCLQSISGLAGRDAFCTPFGLREGDIYFYEITDSTNIRAWEASGQSTGDGALFVADTQSRGKGRRGRNWEGTAGCNLCFSLLLHPETEPERLSMLTLVMALSVAESVEALTGKNCGIKWPNDILLEDRKVCGILTELKLQGNKVEGLIIGVGINVKLQQFPEELQQKAGTLEELSGRTISRSGLLAEVLHRFEQDYQSFLRTKDLSLLKEAYEERMLNRNRQVRVLEPQGAYEGIALGITEDGRLLVKRPEGMIEKVYAGEVSVRGTEGYI